MAARSAFKGFPLKGIEFLRDLRENNDREWFTPRKDVYAAEVYQPMLELVSALHAEMLRFAPHYVDEPKKCVYRIYRDTRFAKNKTPYKTNIAASFWHNRQGKGGGAGFYFSISPEEIEIGGGLYHPEPAALLAVRQHIAGHLMDFRKTFDTPKQRKLTGELWGESAARAPKGFDPADPAIEFIKRKNFLLLVSPEPALATTSKLLPELARRFEAITPFVEFLNRPLLGTPSTRRSGLKKSTR